MSALSYEVASEAAYDLMQDHLDTILALLDGPLPRREVVARLGSETTLQRMLAQGLVRVDGDQLRAVSEAYHQLRQEGMVSFLERYVLPSLTANIAGVGTGSIDTHHLHLSEAAMAGLRAGPVQGLVEDLLHVSDGRGDGAVHRLSVLVVGTSRLVESPADPAEEALRHLKQACMQRSDPAERHKAVLIQFDCLADSWRYSRARDAVLAFLQGFSAQLAEPQAANYHLTVATHWRCASSTRGPRPN